MREGGRICFFMEAEMTYWLRNPENSWVVERRREMGRMTKAKASFANYLKDIPVSGQLPDLEVVTTLTLDLWVASVTLI